MHPQSTLLYVDDVYRPEHLAQRLWSRVDKTGGPDSCWLWQGRRHRKGYGGIGITVNGLYHETKAHRVAYLLTYGSLDAALVVCHRCDTPACCNPAHLWLGTHQDNVRDRDEKGRTATGTRSAGYIHRARVRHRRGEAHPNAKLNAQQVYEMRNLYAQGARVIDIARAYSTTDTNAGYIVRGKTWIERPPVPILVPAQAPPPPTPEERFWALLSRAEIEDGCWLWTGTLNRDGYGTRFFGGRLWRAHRLAWTLVHGPIPANHCLLHLCHVRACCNPAHLRVGTQAENVAHMVASGRYVNHWKRPRR